MGKMNVITQFPQAAERHIEEVEILLQAVASAPFNNVGRHRHGCSTHLGCEGEDFLVRESGRSSVDVSDKLVCQRESLEFPVVSHDRAIIRAARCSLKPQVSSLKPPVSSLKPQVSSLKPPK